MQTSTQAVRARTDEPFLSGSLRHTRHLFSGARAGTQALRLRAATMNIRSRCWPSTKPSRGYDPASGPFGAYASLVIGRRLADHYRSQHRFDAETPLAPQTFDGTVDRESADAAMQQAVAEQMSEAKPVSAQDEIEAANTVFEKYGFAFYDLAASSPKSDKTRRSCAAAVGTLLHSPVLFASMQSAHSLPIKALAQQCGVSARTITRHRDYIVAAALLIDGDYPHPLHLSADHAQGGRAMRAIITDIRAGKAAALAEDGAVHLVDAKNRVVGQEIRIPAKRRRRWKKAADLGGVCGCPVRHGDHRRVRRV